MSRIIIYNQTYNQLSEYYVLLGSIYGRGIGYASLAFTLPCVVIVDRYSHSVQLPDKWIATQV